MLLQMFFVKDTGSQASLVLQTYKLGGGLKCLRKIHWTHSALVQRVLVIYNFACCLSIACTAVESVDLLDIHIAEAFSLTECTLASFYTLNGRTTVLKEKKRKTIIKDTLLGNELLCQLFGGYRQQWISHKMNIRHPRQMTKNKILEAVLEIHTS